jgi:putative DNA primase/helicase
MSSITCFDLPAELTALPQWVIWRYQDRDGKRTKVPHTCQGYKASVTNPRQWSAFDYAIKVWRERPGFADGIGFVFTGDDPYCGIDLDNCYPSDAAETASWAAGILEQFADTYSEESPSGCGVKIWCRARAPRCGRWTVAAGAVEIYDHARFFVVTGHAGSTIPRLVTDHQEDVDLLTANLDERGHGDQKPRLSNLIPQGDRHNALLSLAGTMWRRGMCPEAIEAALLAVNARQCDPPRTPEHIHKIVQSLERWER